MTLATDIALKDYIIDGRRHKCYRQTLDIAERLKIHADGLKPGALLTERRPSESKEVKDYREKIYVEITKSTVSKILNCLGKIRRSQDWSIKYPDEVPSVIRPGETLQDYCEQNYPYFNSVTNWLFNVGLKNYLIDPNGLLVVMPLEFSIAENDYLRPFTFIYNSHQVLDYVQDDYAIIHSTDKSLYKNGTTMEQGEVYYVITTTEIQRWEQMDAMRNMQLTVDFRHNLGRLPAFKLGGVFKEAQDRTFLYESRIDAIVPHLKEAVREYSDLQAEVVQHIHSEKWEYQSQECPSCNGTGKAKRRGTSETVTCSKCKGAGSLAQSPYSTRIVKPPMPGIPAVPIPPAGYIQKQVEIVKIQDERIANHLFRALSAINMEFLSQSPLNQSGTAKEVDRDELNTFVNIIAEDLVYLLDKAYSLICDYRYMWVITSPAERRKLPPAIAVPEKFDLLSSSFLVDEMNKLKTANVNPMLIRAVEIEYAAKKFNNDPQVKLETELVFNLDPLPGVSDEQKLLRLQNKGITELDYVTSCNIYQFVKRALVEDRNFATLAPMRQAEKIGGYAQEKIRENSAANSVMSLVGQGQVQENSGGGKSEPTT